MKKMKHYFRSNSISCPPLLQRFLALVVGTIFVLSLSACGGSNGDNDDTNNGGGSGSITVTVGTGLSPDYSWTGGDIVSITVVRASAPAVPVWGIAAAPASDAVSSSVAHGQVPTGSVQTFGTETILTAGVQYRVTVSRTDSSFGFTEFTPAGSGTPTATLSGTVATGAPFVGMLNVTGSAGAQALGVAIAADGSYDANVAGLVAPFMLQAIPTDATQASLYSFAPVVNSIVNVTQLTTLAMFMSNGNTDLATYYAAWASSAAAFVQQTLFNAQAVINANLTTLLQANSLDASTYDFFTTAFMANSAGIDAVLDDTTVDLAGGNIAVSVAGNSAFSFDTGIDTSSINIGGSSDITITVGSGLTPTYSWNGDSAMSVSVMRTSAPATAVWGIATPAVDGISSAATHGQIPVGAVQTFATEVVLTDGVEYRVSVARIAGSGSGFVDFTAAAVAAPTYSVGGTVSGATSEFVLTNSNSDSLSVTGTSFTFPIAMVDGASYNATVTTQPLNETCSVTNGSGTINGADVNNIMVTCQPTGGGATYIVSGTTKGLTGNIALELRKNGVIVSDLPSVSGTNFSFSTTFDSGQNYTVSITTQPTGQNCTINNDSGTITNADITNVYVSCSSTSNSYIVSGTVTGMTGSLSLELHRNGVFFDDLPAFSGTDFSFNEVPLAWGLAVYYQVIITEHPTGQLCSFTSNYRGLSLTDVDVPISCADRSALNVASATLSVKSPRESFDFSTGAVSEPGMAGDIGGINNEGVNFEGSVYFSRRVLRLATSGSLDAVPAIPVWSGAAPWVLQTWDFTDGTQGLPLAVGEIWAVYTSEGHYAVLQITGLPGGGFGNAFTFDYLYQPDGSRNF